METLLSFQEPPISLAAERQHNFLNTLAKALSATNRPHLEAFIRGEPPGAFHPLTVTLDPTLDCNANCPGCIEHAPMAMARRGCIPWPRMQKLIPELRALGVRAIELYGGEPTFYPCFDDLLRLICDQGLRLGIATNGSLLHRHRDALEDVRTCLDWLRISINAGTAETHRGIFRLPGLDAFELILNSAQKLAGRGLPIGFSYVVTGVNYAEISLCAECCEGAGGQYLQLKPMVHPVSKQLLPLPAGVRRNTQDQVITALVRRHNPDFQIILTGSLRLVLEAEADQELRQPKDYPFCPASLYRAVVTPVSPPGQVISCPYHRASPRHVVGSLSHPLDATWLQGEERAQALTACDPRLDCGFWCNHHTLNEKLWEWRTRYQAGERDILDCLPVTNHPGDCWL